jgi:hypothetical protein
VAKKFMSPPVSAMTGLGGGSGDAGDGVEVVQVLIAGQVGDDAGDPGVEDLDELGQVVDLVQQVPAHPTVMCGELAVQSGDQFGDLSAGAGDGEFGQHVRVAFAGDQRVQDPAGTDSGHITEHAGQLQAGVFEFLLQALDLSAPVGSEFAAAAGHVAQFPDLAGRHERAHDHARGARAGQERRVGRVGLAAPDAAQMRRIDQHHVQPRLQQVVHRAPVIRGRLEHHHLDAGLKQPVQQPAQLRHRRVEPFRLQRPRAGAFRVRRPDAGHQEPLAQVQPGRSHVEDLVMHHAFAHSVRPFPHTDNDYGPSGGIREAKETDTRALAATIGHLDANRSPRTDPRRQADIRAHTASQAYRLTGRPAPTSSRPRGDRAAAGGC